MMGDGSMGWKRIDEDSVNAGDVDEAKDIQKYPKKEKTRNLLINNKGVSERRNFVDLIALVRSLQRAEGNPDCFRRSGDSCEQGDCAWRSYCLVSANAVEED
jgi:hypothetical protein